MFDEITGIFYTSQMSLVIHFIYNKKVYQRFITFINCHKYVYKEQTDDGDNINEEDDRSNSN